MSNNMDLGYEMFCYQCEQTANGKGCTKLGVCGKTPEIANLQDLLIFQIKGISCYGKTLEEAGQHIDKNVIKFIENVLFTTLTNVNFDAKVHVELLRESQQIKEELRNVTGDMKNQTVYLENGKDIYLGRDSYTRAIKVFREYLEKTADKGQAEKK